MKKIFTISFLFISVLFVTGNVFAQQIFSDDFESGVANSDWGVFYPGEDELAAVPMANAPEPLATGGDYVGWLQDVDTSYTGIALALAGTTDMMDYSIEADVYCYVNHPDGSAYTGVAFYCDSSYSSDETYIKMVADFDSDQRIRLFNNHFDFVTFEYTFDYTFDADSIPGGIPTQSGWHKMKVEVKTLNSDSTAFWCYFDDQLLGGCPVIDDGDDRMSSGKFGVYVFQNGFPLAGYFDNVVVNSLITDVSNESSGIPDGFYLEQNYPNPFNPETQIAYKLASGGLTTLGIYDLLGREVKELVNQDQASGNYTVNWNGTDELGNKVPSGVYFYKLKSGNFIETKKMILMK